MPINGLSIATGATSLSVTGGTAQVYAPDGQPVTNGVHVAVTAVTDFRVRPHISFKNRNPQKRSDGTFTQGTRTITLTEPYMDAAGVVHYDTITIERRYSASIPDANLKSARYKAAQVLFDSDVENFNTSGDIS